MAEQSAIETYEIGKTYLVPTVIYPWFGRTSAWPVIGPLHDDIEFFNFDAKHYHVDHRFLSDRNVAFLDRQARWRLGGLQTAFGTPLCWRDRSGDREWVPHPKPVIARRLCRRDWGVFPRDKIPAVSKPQVAFADRELLRKDGDLICPHRGATITTVRPDASGVITCPLHGLRWCAKSGGAVADDHPRAA